MVSMARSEIEIKPGWCSGCKYVTLCRWLIRRSVARALHARCYWCAVTVLVHY